MEEKMSLKEGSPILGEVFKPLDEQKEGPQGERLTGADYKKLPKWAQATLAVALLGGALKAVESANINISSASESGPTPIEVPTPPGIAGQARDFDRTIEEINREPNMVVEATPKPTEIQQEQKETPIPEKAGVEGIEISEIPSSTASTLYFLWAPIYPSQVAEKLKISEEEFLSYNKFLLKECDVDSRDCPYVSFDQKI